MYTYIMTRKGINRLYKPEHMSDQSGNYQNTKSYQL